MSGHSKWHSIKHKKNIADTARGKVFSKHSKLIQIVARHGGGDPEKNPGLRLAIDNAKNDNVPNANIDRAIKKGSGALQDGQIIEEVTYEGYGPEGIALLINCLTDNRNRTVANVKYILAKNGGNLGESGSVSWMFKRKGVIEVSLNNHNPEEAELIAIDCGADNLDIENGVMIVTTPLDSYINIKEKLRQAGLEVKSAKTDYIPDNYVLISDTNKANKIIKLIEALEEDDDVDTVASNFDIEENLLI